MTNNFTKLDAAATALRSALHSGVGDLTVGVIKKIHDAGPGKIDDQLLKRAYVRESPMSVSVNAIKKIHQAGARPETGDTMTKMRHVTDADIDRLLAHRDNLRKTLNSPSLRDVGQLPGQSSNASWDTPDPRRVGGVPGVADRDSMFGGPTPTQASPLQAESIGSRSAGPEDTDADKRKGRSRRAKLEPAPDDPLSYPADDSCLDACGKAIRELHRQGGRRLFER